MLKVLNITYSNQKSIGPQQGYKWRLISANAQIQAVSSTSDQYFQMYDAMGLRLLDFNETVASDAGYNAYGGYITENVGTNPSGSLWAYPPEFNVSAPISIGSSLATGTTVSIQLLVDEMVDL